MSLSNQKLSRRALRNAKLVVPEKVALLDGVGVVFWDLLNQELEIWILIINFLD